MSSISLSTAWSGMSAANERLRASSSAVTASLRTDPLAVRATAAVQHASPVEPAVATVEQQSATYAFVANLRVLQTQLRAEGAMLDIHA